MKDKNPLDNFWLDWEIKQPQKRKDESKNKKKNNN